jgi:hypothetical protein
MISYTWTIENCIHEVATGGITDAYWRVYAQDDNGEHSASVYGSSDFTPDATSENFKPYNEVTEEEILGWVFADSEVNKESIETSLSVQIEELKNPVIAFGRQWNSA